MLLVATCQAMATGAQNSTESFYQYFSTQTRVPFFIGCAFIVCAGIAQTGELFEPARAEAFYSANAYVGLVASCGVLVF